MITLKEIESIEFKKAGMSGYKANEVEAFVDSVIEFAKAQTRQIEDLEEKLYALADKVEEYRADEESIKDTVISAKKIAEKILVDAKIKADGFIAEADKKAVEIIGDAEKKSILEADRLNKLKQEISEFKTTVLSLYKAHLESISKLPNSPESREEIKEDNSEIAEDIKEIEAENSI